MKDRWQFDGDMDHLDELVVHNATVHLEAMSSHVFALIIDKSDGLRIHLNVSDVTPVDIEGMNLLATEVNAPLLGCSVEWTSQGRQHRCDQMSPRHHGRHQCECGSWKANK